MRIQSLLAVAALVAAPLLATVGTASAAPAAAPPLIVSPNPAVPGDSVTLSGAGCVGRDSDPAQVTLYVVDAQINTDADSTKKIAAADDEGDPIVTPKPDGTWSYELDKIPGQYPSIDITFGAVCDSYTGSFQYKPATLQVDGNIDATFLLLPDFLGSKPVLDAGKSYDLAAFGFKPGEKVDLVLHSTPVQIATFVAAEDSTAIGRFTVPLDTIGGAHVLEMVGQDSGRKASLPIEVVAASVTTTAPSTTSAPSTTTTVSTTPQAISTTTSVIAAPVLASTGTSAVPQMTGAGIALTLGGVGALLFARRSRSRSH